MCVICRMAATMWPLPTLIWQMASTWPPMRTAFTSACPFRLPAPGLAAAAIPETIVWVQTPTTCRAVSDSTSVVPKHADMCLGCGQLRSCRSTMTLWQRVILERPTARAAMLCLYRLTGSQLCLCLPKSDDQPLWPLDGHQCCCPLGSRSLQSGLRLVDRSGSST